MGLGRRFPLVFENINGPSIHCGVINAAESKSSSSKQVVNLLELPELDRMETHKYPVSRGTNFLTVPWLRRIYLQSIFRLSTALN